MKERLEQVASAMRKRGFLVTVTDNADQAASFIRESIPAEAAVAVGGSMTVKNMGLHTQLREDGHKVLWHWEAAPADRRAVLLEAMQAPYYICSANAVAEDGLIVQLDGTGNRVSAIIYGPETVLVIAGMNKVMDTLEDAMTRARTVAAPMNKQRFPNQTPCEVTGSCGDCKAEGCICNQILITRHCRPVGRIKFIIVGEELGL